VGENLFQTSIFVFQFILDRRSRHKRIRAKIKGTKSCPRFSVFRSNSNLYYQLIDDESGRTLLASDTRKIKTGKTRTEKAKKMGEEASKKAIELGIKKAVFDRGGFKYHGAIRAVAEGAREGGLNF
jgi:large subunit ribosomal protein L18